MSQQSINTEYKMEEFARTLDSYLDSEYRRGYSSAYYEPRSRFGEIHNKVIAFIKDMKRSDEDQFARGFVAGRAHDGEANVLASFYE